MHNITYKKSWEKSRYLSEECSFDSAEQRIIDHVILKVYS